jgi:hypothetical protein
VSKGATPPSPAVEEASAKLAEFLAANPKAFVEERSDGGAPILLLCRPWGDEAVGLQLEGDYSTLADTLNHLVLPERLTAIWHRDSRKLEIIWTARKLVDVWEEVVERKFSFTYQGRQHTCHFTDSSDRLLTLAAAFRPLRASAGSAIPGYRNLTSYYAYLRSKDTGESNLSIGKPLSFWISNVDWNEVDTIDLLRSISFYLTYYDFRSPTIIIHDPMYENASSIAKTRYLRGKFPKTISARQIDQNLLTYWGAAGDYQPMLAFILYYRIIEYASTHYIDYKIKSELKKIISAPHLTDDLAGSVESIVGTMSKNSLDEVPRFEAVIRSNVNPRFIWKDIKENISIFSKEMKFEGGFSVKALCGANEKEEAFCSRGLDQFSRSIRKIRNTLSHGRDQETADMILPTAQNVALLRPWVHLIATAAGEVVLYKDVS